MHPMTTTNQTGRRVAGPFHPEAGYSLLEMVVALALSVAILLGVLALFDVNNRIARGQVNVADMQQSLRIAQSSMVRIVRMAGRGGLPVFRAGTKELPDGLALAVRNDVEADQKMADEDSAKIEPGTDVLTVRGVFSTPLYQLDPAGGGNIDGALAAGSGELVISSLSPTGIPQVFNELVTAVSSGRPEALLLVGATNDQIQAVVQLTGGTVNDTEATLRFSISDATLSKNYLALSPGGAFPNTLTSVAAVGILEEYRYYVRDADPAPRLSRARFYPGTERAYADDASNLHVDIADNVLDLQVALGIDLDGDQVITDSGDTADEWLFNAEKDLSIKDKSEWNNLARPLYYARISTLARTDRPAPDYVSPVIPAIEDRTYEETKIPDSDHKIERSYRRRILQTVIDMRNLS
jgi:hypothetical protein